MSADFLRYVSGVVLGAALGVVFVLVALDVTVKARKERGL